jgi:UrcA family protein
MDAPGGSGARQRRSHAGMRLRRHARSVTAETRVVRSVIDPRDFASTLSYVVDAKSAVSTTGDQTMNALLRVNTLRRRLPIALAIGALAAMSAGAHADNLDEVTISAPATKIVGRDYATGAPIEQETVTANVKFDPVTLTTNSGVALLKDSVLAAARKACYAADPLTMDDDGTCVHDAVKSAKPQVDAAIARARSNANA